MRTCNARHPSPSAPSFDEDGHSDVGTDLIEWVLQIHNSGTVTLHDIAIDDPLLGGSISGVPATLAAGATFNIAINHFLTADDVAAGDVFNSATATALDPSNNLLTVMAHYDQLCASLAGQLSRRR